jgi:hypothetical protein
MAGKYFRDMRDGMNDPRYDVLVASWVGVKCRSGWHHVVVGLPLDWRHWMLVRSCALV